MPNRGTVCFAMGTAKRFKSRCRGGMVQSKDSGRQKVATTGRWSLARLATVREESAKSPRLQIASMRRKGSSDEIENPNPEPAMSNESTRPSRRSWVRKRCLGVPFRSPPKRTGPSIAARSEQTCAHWLFRICKTSRVRRGSPGRSRRSKAWVAFGCMCTLTSVRGCPRHWI